MTTMPESALQPCGRRMNTIFFNSDWTKACSASKWPKSNPNSHAIAANVRIPVTDGHEEKVKKKTIRLLVTLKTFPINYHVAQLAYKTTPSIEGHGLSYIIHEYMSSICTPLIVCNMLFADWAN